MWRIVAFIALIALTACQVVTQGVPSPLPALTKTPAESQPATTTAPPANAPAAVPTASPPSPYVVNYVDIQTSTCATDDPRVGGPALCVAIEHADMDGDGRADEILFYLAGVETHRRLADAIWTVELRTRAGARAKAMLGASLPPERPQIIGVADANGDGRPELFVNTGHGASTQWVGIVTFDGTKLSAIGGYPPLLYSGSVRHGAAIECRFASDRWELVQRRVSDYVALDQWDMVEDVYVWSAAGLTLAYSATSTLTYRGSQPTPVGRYWGFACGAIRSEAWAWS